MAVQIHIWPIDKPQRVFGGEAAGVGIVDAVAVVMEAKGVAHRLAGGEDDAIEVGANLGADAAEGGVGVGLDGRAAFVRQRGDGTETVGMEDLPGPRHSIDERDPLDRLVHSLSIDVGPHDLVARVNFHHRIGSIIDESGGKAIVQTLADAVSFAVEGIGEDRAVGVGERGHAGLEVIGIGAGLIRKRAVL